MRKQHIMPARERLVTAEEFAQIPDDDHKYELVRGRVIRMSPPGARHAVVATRIAVLLTSHADAQRLGAVFTPSGFHLESDPDTVREPDVAFIHRDRIGPAGVPDGFWPGPPDLAVEINSPGDRPSEIKAKVAEYLSLGVRLVWVVDPKKRTVTVHRPSAAAVTLGAGDTLDAGDVIPGFTCAVSRVFD
jgi:Uma2 family endonuclease